MSGSGAPYRYIDLNQIDLQQLCCAALIVTLGAGFVFAGVFLVRGGLAGTAGEILSMFELAILPIWASVMALTWVEGDPVRVAMTIAVSIFSMALYPIIGLAAGHAVAWFAGGILLLALATVRHQLYFAIRGAKLLVIFSAVPLAFLLVTFTAPPRLFLPENLVLGTALTDLYYDNAITQMIVRYGAISVGGDGLAYNHYHFLSHAIAGGTAKASGASVSLVYLYWGAFTLKLQLIWCGLLAGMFFFRSEGTLSERVISRFAYVCLMAIFISMGFESESFTLGVALLFAALPLLMALARSNTLLDRPTSVAIMLAIFTSFLCTLAKVSAGFFCAIGLAVVLWRFRARSAISATIIIFLAVLAFVTLSWIAERGLTQMADPLNFIVGYLNYFSWLTIKNYLLSIFVVVLFLTRWRIDMNTHGPSLTIVAVPDALPPLLMPDKSRKDRLVGKLAWFGQLDCIPQFMALSLLGCLLILFTVPIGNNNAYFSWVMYASALLFLPAALGNVISARPSRRTIARLLIVFLILNLLSGVTDFFILRPDNLPSTLREVYRVASDAPAALHIRHRRFSEAVSESLKTTGLPFSELQQMIESAPIKSIDHALHAEAKTVGGRLAVYIPPQAKGVWRKLQPYSTWWCMAGHLVVPAVTGFVEIRSIAPRSVEQECVPNGVAFYGFGAQQDLHRSIPLSNAALCERAKLLGVQKVYRLQSYENLSENLTVNCSYPLATRQGP